jgi:hypothetical protein
MHAIFTMAAHGIEHVYDTERNTRPCRACVDFKTWTKQQKTTLTKVNLSNEVFLMVSTVSLLLFVYLGYGCNLSEMLTNNLCRHPV